MIFTVKKLTAFEKRQCLKTISAKAMFAIIGDALKGRRSISVVRAGDGEAKILRADKSKPFTGCNRGYIGWNKRMGIKGMPTDILQKKIVEAGNACTYFAPSVSGISIPRYHVYDFFKMRSHYFDNFYVNEWTAEMIKILLLASDGVFIVHRDYKKIIRNFKRNYNFTGGDKVDFGGFPKDNWRDNEQAIYAAVKSGMQLILFSAGPAGKIIGPEIAKAKNKIVLDVGNTLMHWSIKKPSKTKIVID